VWQDVADLAASLGLSSGTFPAALAPAAGSSATSGTLASSASVPTVISPWQLILDAGPVVAAVLYTLLAASVLCWAIIVGKALLLAAARARSRWFLRALARSDEDGALDAVVRAARGSPHARLFLVAQREAEKASSETPGRCATPADGAVRRLERALAKAVDAEVTRMEGWLGWLATVGSTAPFVGLFGTVWGIMTSFMNIGAQESATLAVVAPGIAEALIATAVGLIAAIPAVVAYNAFVRRIRVWHEDLSAFAAKLVNDADAAQARSARSAGKTPFVVAGVE